MSKQSKQSRQAIGCGWEATDPRVPVGAWSPAGMSAKWKGDVQTCPGYTTKLPVVTEACRARVHWEKNAAAFTAYCEGDPTEHMLAAVEILEGAVNEVSAWTMTPKSEGGGRD
jgi:hypothetical protein